MPVLNGKQIESLQKILTALFTTNEMAELLKTDLDIDLEQAVFGKQGSNHLYFELIGLLDRQDRIPDFLAAAAKARPRSTDLAKFCEDLQLPAPDARARNLVASFRTVFDDRRFWFTRLDAYKRLHETLHKLRDQLGGIRQAVDEFLRTPDTTVPLVALADTLDGLIADARRAQPGLDPTEEAHAWVDEFGGTVTRFRGAFTPLNTAVLSRAVEELAALPNRQAGLNRELVVCAKGLRAADRWCPIAVVQRGR